MTKAESIRFNLRPDASNGLWLCTLIPLAYMTNTWKHKPFVQFQGKVSTIVAFGLFLETLLILLEIRTNKSKKTRSKILWSLPAVFTSFLIWICLNQTTAFSLCCGPSAILFYAWLYVYLLKVLPESFTLGEASVVAQGFVLFLLNAGLRLFEFATYTEEHQIDDISLILQVGQAGVTLIVTATHLFSFFRNDQWFYSLVGVVSLVVALFPVKEHFALTVLFSFLFGDMQRAMIAAISLLAVTVVIVIWFLVTNRQSNTRTRKLFHLLIVAVFLPGVIFQCQFLFATTVLLLAVFVVLETARTIELTFVSDALDQAIQLFIDEKDAGEVALTPIYLLVGCALPLWLHPCPWCPLDNKMTDMLPLLSGVLSVGVGDTVASVVGSKFGRNMWLNGDKSIEGILASIVAQGLTLAFLIYFHYLSVTTFQIYVAVVAIIVNSLIEANTNQVDNLVLPLVTFIMLSLR